MRIGIIGTGRIADRFVKAVTEYFSDINIVCVYNPRLESAEKFAYDRGIDCYTDNLEEMFELVDSVYIASLHETHSDYAQDALIHKKHVLCEKPLALTEADAQALYKTAGENECILMEAVKTAYCPGFQTMMEIAHSGVIGVIKDVEAGFTRLTPTNVREYTDSGYGGSFMEFGSYVMLPALKLLGTAYRDVTFKKLDAPSGVDYYTKIFMEYDKGMALGKTGLGVKSEGQLLISGTKGYILAESPWWMTKKFEVRFEDPNIRQVYNCPYEGSGLQYEINAFERAVREKISETQELYPGAVFYGLRPDESIAMAGIMELFLKQRRAENEEKSLVSKDAPKRVDIWAHRGCSMKYPENTLASFKAAAEIPGIMGIELDVQMTKDGEVVVFHDERVSRVTKGQKNVVDYTLEELKQLNIENGTNEYDTIPTLEEVLLLLKPYCEKKGLLINIELKTSVIRYEGIEEKTLELVRKFGLERYIVYSSFLAESLKHMKELDGSVKTGMLGSSLADCIVKARQVCADALHPWIGGLDCIIPEDMKNLPVRAWNAEEPFFRDGRILREKNLEKYSVFGVTEVFTNVPEVYLL